MNLHQKSYFATYVIFHAADWLIAVHAASDSTFMLATFTAHVRSSFHFEFIMSTTKQVLLVCYVVSPEYEGLLVVRKPSRQRRHFPILSRGAHPRKMVPSKSRNSRDQRRVDTIHATRVSANAVVLVAVGLSITSRMCKQRRRRAAIRRARPSFDSVCCYLSAQDFTRSFRMPREAFDELLNTLEPFLERDLRRASSGSGGVIELDARLAILLRILAGASNVDLQLTLCTGRGTAVLRI
jgi:hypothetical protein